MGTRLAKEMGGKRAVAGARRRVSAAAGQGHQQQQDNETGVPENTNIGETVFFFSLNILEVIHFSHLTYQPHLSPL